MGSIFYTCKMFPFKILGIVFIKIYVYPTEYTGQESEQETDKKIDHINSL